MKFEEKGMRVRLIQQENVEEIAGSWKPSADYKRSHRTCLCFSSPSSSRIALHRSVTNPIPSDWWTASLPHRSPAGLASAHDNNGGSSFSSVPWSPPGTPSSLSTPSTGCGRRRRKGPSRRGTSNCRDTAWCGCWDCSPCCFRWCSAILRVWWEWQPWRSTSCF